MVADRAGRGTPAEAGAGKDGHGGGARPPAAVNSHPGAVSPREKNAARRPDRIVNNLTHRLKNRTLILQAMLEIGTC